MSIVKISALPLLTTATGATVVAAVHNTATMKLSLDGVFNYVLSDLVNVSVNAKGFTTTGTISANTLTFTSGSQLTFGDVPVTNRFYVDPARLDYATYTADGSVAKPFRTINAATTAANASLLNPSYIVLTGSITENVTLTKGHVYLIGESSSVAAPIVLTGSITINGSDSSGSAISNNHFAIQGIQLATGGSANCITFTGANPQRLSLNNVWLSSGTGATGAGVYADNTGTGSVIDGKIVKVSHGGSGDVYCFNIVHGTANFWDVETSGATQVGAVRAGAVLTINASELDANGDTVLETYDTGMLVVTNSLVTNVAPNSYGIKMNGTGGVVAVGQTAFNIPLSATGQVLWVSTASLYSVFSFAGMTFYPGANTTISTSSYLTTVPVVSAVGTIAYPIFAGPITATAAPQSWTMYDNAPPAALGVSLAFGTATRPGMLAFVTTGSTTGGLVSTGYIKTLSTTATSLPIAAVAGAGARAFITDASTTTFLAAVAGGGTYKVPVVSNGTSWVIG
jgi:hypothetical protein